MDTNRCLGRDNSKSKGPGVILNWIRPIITRWQTCLDRGMESLWVYVHEGWAQQIYSYISCFVVTVKCHGPISMRVVIVFNWPSADQMSPAWAHRVSMTMSGGWEHPTLWGDGAGERPGEPGYGHRACIARHSSLYQKHVCCHGDVVQPVLPVVGAENQSQWCWLEREWDGGGGGGVQCMLRGRRAIMDVKAC